MTQQINILEDLLKLTESHGPEVLVVFDLDSTLYDVSPRITKIIHDFANEPQWQKLYPEECKRLSTVKLERGDWGIKKTLERQGFTTKDMKLIEAVRDYWFLHFFGNEYLKYDKPYEGAVKYAKDLAQRGATIRYLTGRDQHRMGEGTITSLKQWDFPLSNNMQELILKPHKELIDHDFKRDWFRDVLHQNYKHTWFFENEPLNIEVLINEPTLSHIDIIFFDSTHSGRAEAPHHLPKIVDYRY